MHKIMCENEGLQIHEYEDSVDELLRVELTVEFNVVCFVADQHIDDNANSCSTSRWAQTPRTRPSAGSRAPSTSSADRCCAAKSVFSACATAAPAAPARWTTRGSPSRSREQTARRESDALNFVSAQSVRSSWLLPSILSEN